MSTIDPQIINLLRELGLGRTEQVLYLRGLGKIDASVSWLIEGTNINRTTAYHALGTLKQKGFLTESKILGRLVYRMNPPRELDRLLSIHKAHIESQKQQLLELEHLFPAGVVQELSTSVEKFEGIDSVKQAIDKALYCKSRQWSIIAPRRNFFVDAGIDYAAYFMETRRSRGITSRTLWESVDQGRISLQDLMMRKPRYLPEAFTGKFKSIIIMFDNKVLLVSSYDRQSAVLVESSEIVDTIHVMFDALWLLSDKPIHTS